jgi:hypothetical protein
MKNISITISLLPLLIIWACSDLASNDYENASQNSSEENEQSPLSSEETTISSSDQNSSSHISSENCSSSATQADFNLIPLNEDLTKVCRDLFPASTNYFHLISRNKQLDSSFLEAGEYRIFYQNGIVDSVYLKHYGWEGEGWRFEIDFDNRVLHNENETLKYDTFGRFLEQSYPNSDTKFRINYTDSSITGLRSSFGDTLRYELVEYKGDSLYHYEKYNDSLKLRHACLDLENECHCLNSSPYDTGQFIITREWSDTGFIDYFTDSYFENEPLLYWSIVEN